MCVEQDFGGGGGMAGGNHFGFVWPLEQYNFVQRGMNVFLCISLNNRESDS